MPLGDQAFCCRYAINNSIPISFRESFILELSKVYAYTERFQVVHGKAKAKKMQKSILEHAAVTVPIEA